MPPFVVFSLPRSRSTWNVAWLRAASGAPVAHDAAIEMNTIDEWLEFVFRRVRGTCETGAVEAWPILRRAISDCRIAVVRRNVDEVGQSLMRLGLDPTWANLDQRARALDELSEQPGVLRVEYEELADPRACARLQEHLLGVPFDWPAWERFDQTNVQLDIGARIERLTARREPIAALKREMAARLETPAPFVTVGEEPWLAVGDACEALGAAHHVEATEGLEGPYRLDRGAIGRADAAGMWRVIVARVDNEIVGYCCWTVEVNVEADAPATMRHGPFYVAPDASLRRHHLGRRLLDVSRTTFAREGIKVLRVHHTMHGRGARVGRLYERMGAIEYERQYIMRIG